MGQLPYADIVILALVAGFILLRLRNVLGQKSDQDPLPPQKREERTVGGERESVVQLVQKLQKPKSVDEQDAYLCTVKDAALLEAFANIKKLDPQFSATTFLQGAKMAYEMVFDAFAKDDKKTLEMLMDKPIYETFAQAIEARQQADHKTEITLLSVKSKDIVSASLVGSRARLAVKFDSEQVSLTKNAAGEVIEGNASEVQLMDDEWVFERDVSSKNPNWKILET